MFSCPFRDSVTSSDTAWLSDRVLTSTLNSIICSEPDVEQDVRSFIRAPEAVMAVAAQIRSRAAPDETLRN